jgi:hypothetical protein
MDLFQAKVPTMHIGDVALVVPIAHRDRFLERRLPMRRLWLLASSSLT